MNVNTFKSPAKSEAEFELHENSGEMPVIPAEEFTWAQYHSLLNDEDHSI